MTHSLKTITYARRQNKTKRNVLLFIAHKTSSGRIHSEMILKTRKTMRAQILTSSAKAYLTCKPQKEQPKSPCDGSVQRSPAWHSPEVHGSCCPLTMLSWANENLWRAAGWWLLCPAYCWRSWPYAETWIKRSGCRKTSWENAHRHHIHMHFKADSFSTCASIRTTCWNALTMKKFVS